MQLEMEIAQADHVQAQRLHRREILEGRIERSGQALPAGEVEMEVVDEGLVAGNRLERVAVREREHRLTRRFAGLGAGVEVDAHLLHGSGRRVVEREVLRVARFFLALRHADADPELALGVLAVPHETEIRVLLAREEERVRRRERGERAALRFGDDQAILRLHAGQCRVDDATELVVLHMPAGVAPGDARREIGGQALEAGVVLVGNPFFTRRRRRIHPDQVRPLVDGELQIARENPHRQTGERDDQAGAVGLHAARGRVEGGIGAANLRRGSRRAERAVRNERIARRVLTAAAAATGVLR
ncbi:MAG: hypothetical protein JF610_11320 [Acidobacteria bacterium]|nr:hypothetical protein [Acidobacteriota bacterium]